MDDWEERTNRRRGHKTFKDTIDIIIDNCVHMPHQASQEAKEAELNSEQFTLRRAFLLLATDCCKENGLEPGSNEALNIFEEANDRANDIIYAYTGLPLGTEEKLALSPEKIKAKLALTVPRYIQNLIPYVHEYGKLGAPQEWLSSGVGRYVQSRFKSPDIDRLLLQALTQVEIVAYIHEMTWKNILTGTSKLEDAAPPSIFRVIWNAFKFIFVVWIVSVWIMVLPLMIPALAQDLMLLIGLSLGGLGTLCLLFIGMLGITGAIKERPRKRKLQQSITEMMHQMNCFYLEFRGDGPFSLSHFKRRVNELYEAGVVWPSGLFVLIEDMEGRGVKSF